MISDHNVKLASFGLGLGVILLLFVQCPASASALDTVIHQLQLRLSLQMVLDHYSSPHFCSASAQNHATGFAKTDILKLLVFPPFYAGTIRTTPSLYHYAVISTEVAK